MRSLPPLISQYTCKCMHRPFYKWKAQASIPVPLGSRAHSFCFVAVVDDRNSVDVRSLTDDAFVRTWSIFDAASCRPIITAYLNELFFWLRPQRTTRQVTCYFSVLRPVLMTICSHYCMKTYRSQFVHALTLNQGKPDTYQGRREMFGLGV